MPIERFEDIESWQLARRLTSRIYGIWNNPGVPRDFALRDQMLRCTGSVMHNIAEGFDAGGNREFVRFLGYAKRSCTELQSQLYIALDQGYVNQQEFDELYEASRLSRAKIGAFMHYLAHTDHPSKPTKTPLQRRSPENRSAKPRTPNPEP
jgi:four helix bundle protein